MYAYVCVYVCMYFRAYLVLPDMNGKSVVSVDTESVSVSRLHRLLLGNCDVRRLTATDKKRQRYEDDTTKDQEGGTKRRREAAREKKSRIRGPTTHTGQVP